jgi:hypothetical protein
MGVRIVVGLFMVLHGLVHFLYVGHGLRLFELPGLAWPDESWVFARWLGQGAVRWLAAIACGVALLWFVVGGVAILAEQGWWRPAIVGAAVFSTAIWILFWNGTLHQLADQGVIAILINGVIVVAVLVFRWPEAVGQ